MSWMFFFFVKLDMWTASMGYHGVKTWEEVEDEDDCGEVRLYASLST